MKLYYNKENGYLCNRYPHDYESKEDSPYIEIDDEEQINKTYSCPYGQVWAVVDDKLQLIDDTILQSDDKYKEFKKTVELLDLKQYLTDTDYVITKLQEAQLEDEEEYETLKVQYADILTKRKETRVKIRELEGDN